MNFNFKNEIVLENSRVKIEPLKEFHLEYLLPIALNHPSLLKYSPSVFGSEANLVLYIEDALNARSKEKRYPFVIFDNDSNRFIGSTSFGNVSNHDQRLEIGWTWIDKKTHGTGLNKQCKFLLLQYIFEVLKFERVELKTDARNLQSRRAIEKIGGKFEGELRSHTLMLDGHRRDTVYYSILKDEWIEIKNSVFSEFV